MTDLGEIPDLVVLVTGSRTWRYEMTAQAQLELLTAGRGPRRMLIHGGATGADGQMFGYAAGLGWAIRVFLPEYDRFPPRIAPLRRSDEMVRLLARYKRAGAAVECLALWRDHSGGTGYTIDRCRSAGIEPVILHDCRCH